MATDEELQESFTAVRAWQRHVLLREFGDNGHVLPVNLELSRHIDRILSRLIDECSYADLRASGGIVGAP
jgi:hypothetical protein